MSKSRLLENKKLFKTFRKGDAGALVEMLENERMSLFDYLMRMIGQVEKSSDTIDEVFLTITEDILADLQSFDDLRVMLYATSRRFNSDIWNADTTLLENEGIGAAFHDKGVDKEILDGLNFLQALDRAQRALKPFEREVAYLRLSAGLAMSDISDILGQPQLAIEKAYDSAMSNLVSATNFTRDQVEDGLHRMPKHPLPPRSSHATVNLSMVMEGIKTRPAGVWSIRRTVILTLIVLAVAAWYFVPSVVTEALIYTRDLLGIKY